MSVPPGTGDAASGKATSSAFDDLLNAALRAQTAKASQSAPAGVSDEEEAATYLEIHRIAEDQRHRHREVMTPALRNIAQVWIFAVILILVWQGFGSKIGFFQLSDSVLITLLTTTTVNVLGLFLIALNYLYAKQDRTVQATVRRRTKSLSSEKP